MNFKIKPGETVGFVGKNGSGKSTLLKILTEVLTPTTGQLKINGKVSALLELGALVLIVNIQVWKISILMERLWDTAEKRWIKKVDDIVKFCGYWQIY